MDVIFLIIFFISIMDKKVDNVIMKKVDMESSKIEETLFESDEESLLQCAQRCNFIDSDSAVDFRSFRCRCIKYRTDDELENHGTLTKLFVSQEIMKMEIPKKFISECLTKKTNRNNYDVGHAWYLDRHIIKCNDGYGLTSFKLIYSKADQNPVKNSMIQYVYECCSLPATSCTNSGYVDSAETDEKKGEIREIKEHPVKCEKGVISGFRYSPGDKDIKPRGFFYRSWCCYPYTQPVCYDNATAVKLMDGVGTDNLAHHDVVCQQGYTLGSFQLHHKEERQDEWINYKFTCCKVFVIS